MSPFSRKIVYGCEALEHELDELNTSEIFGFDKQFEDAGYIRLTPSTERG
jgi:hypothetical protein